VGEVLRLSGRFVEVGALGGGRGCRVGWTDFEGSIVCDMYGKTEVGKKSSRLAVRERSSCSNLSTGYPLELAFTGEKKHRGCRF